MSATYRNPWFPKYGPANYETSARPVAYRGYLIFQRIAGQVWDVVKDGVCVTQMAGPNGARRAIDEELSEAGKNHPFVACTREENDRREPGTHYACHKPKPHCIDCGEIHS